MLQRAMGALALLGGALLAGSYLAQAASGFNGDPARVGQAPASVSAPAPAPGRDARGKLGPGSDRARAGPAALPPGTIARRRSWACSTRSIITARGR